MSTTDILSPKPRRTLRVIQATSWLFKHWLLVFLIAYSLFWGLPFLAPIFMKMGWTGPAQIIYFIYGFFCHQMAQRSYFLFGSQPMYTLAQLPVKLTGDELTNTFALRDFIGSAELGWKVAWSDRMVSLYGGVLLAAVIFWMVRQRGRLALPHWGLAIMGTIPIVIDGATHWVSDFSGGLEKGFRYSNDWLAALTAHTLPTWFYVGDTVGSFNFWMRLLTGLSFGFIVGWFVLYATEQYFGEVVDILSYKLVHADPDKVGKS